MARSQRHQEIGQIVHITARGNAGRDLFWEPRDFQAFHQMLWRTVLRSSWSCLSYCLMPNHIHLLIRLDALTLSRGMQRLLTQYARWHNDQRERYGHVFQGRFHSRTISDATHLLEAVRYIALNPVRAGLCEEPGAWPWSAHRALAGADPPRLVAISDTLELFGARGSHERYQAFIGETTCAEAVTSAFDARAKHAHRARRRTLSALVERVGPEEAIVVARRELACSFSEIGAALGVHRSTAARRFGRLTAERATRGV